MEVRFHCAILYQIHLRSASARKRLWECCHCCQYPVPVANGRLETGNIGTVTLATFTAFRRNLHRRQLGLRPTARLDARNRPDFATSFFEKCGLSQCSRGWREKTAIICSNHILENLDPRLECSDASLRVYPLSSTDAKSREDSSDVLAGRIQHLIVFSRLAEHLPFAQRL